MRGDPVCHAVRMRIRLGGRLPVVRPRGQIELVEEVLGEASLDLVDGAIAQHLRHLAEVFPVHVSLGAGLGRVVGAAPAERLKLLRVGRLAHETYVRRQLIVEAPSTQLHRVIALELDVEGRIGRVPDAHAWLALVFEMPEEVQLVAQDRSTEREGDLLVVDRHDAIQYRVLRVELAVAEVATDRAREACSCRSA